MNGWGSNYENIFRNNTPNNQQIQENAKKDAQEEVVNTTTSIEQENPKDNLILIKGKTAEKGLKSFLRCGVKFSDNFQELEVNEKTLQRLKLEPKLTIQEVKK